MYRNLVSFIKKGLHGESNLPVLVTAPGAKLARAYIYKHFTPWNKTCLTKDKKGVNWGNRLIHHNKQSLPPELESTIPTEPILMTPKHGISKKKQSPQITVNKSDDFRTTMSVCGE